ncbi:MAG: SGNH/GDSL hydrolase family protein [Candidatus Rokubacteria bacterium]|nr:SGNH/GDSL hydrolase family protein [Candidatus Rokubacteria bacterium]
MRSLCLLSGLVVAVAIGAITRAGAEPGRRALALEGGRPALYVALGDSTVEGVGATSPGRSYVGQLYERLRSVSPQARLVNLGVSGATAGDVRQGQLSRAIVFQPDLVTVSVGPNDITRRRTPRQYEDDVEAILEALARETRAVVVVNLIPDITVTPRYRRHERAAALRQRVEVFNEVLGRRAAAHGAAVVDLFGPSREEVPRHPGLISADDYHPSDEGYARWAELMWRGIEERIRR